MTTSDNTTEVPLKRCAKCGELKLATTDFFHIRKDLATERLRNECKLCRQLYEAE